MSILHLFFLFLSCFAFPRAKQSHHLPSFFFFCPSLFTNFFSPFIFFSPLPRWEIRKTRAAFSGIFTLWEIFLVGLRYSALFPSFATNEKEVFRFLFFAKKIPSSWIGLLFASDRDEDDDVIGRLLGRRNKISEIGFGTKKKKWGSSGNPEGVRRRGGGRKIVLYCPWGIKGEEGGEG